MRACALPQQRCRIQSWQSADLSPGPGSVAGLADPAFSRHISLFRSAVSAANSIPGSGGRTYLGMLRLADVRRPILDNVCDKGRQSFMKILGLAVIKFAGPTFLDL